VVDPSNSLDASQKLGVRLPNISFPFAMPLSLIEPPRATVAALVVAERAAILPSRLDLSPSEHEAGPGGGAVLTGFGASVLERYKRMVAAASAAVADDLGVLGRAVAPKQSPL
jgi:hypothetical protein